jgi:hypothetical protein
VSTKIHALVDTLGNPIRFLLTAGQMHCAAGPVAFLTYVDRAERGRAQLITPTAVASVLGLVGVWSSVAGNEVVRRLGRSRFVYAVSSRRSASLPSSALRPRYRIWLRSLSAIRDAGPVG